MEITERFDYDIIILGAGLAGLCAAVRMAEQRPDLRVAVISKVHPVRSHSGAAQGGINAAVAADDRWQDHYYDTVKGGGYLGDQDAVRILVEQGPQAIHTLDRWGAVFSRNPDGAFSQRPFGGQRRNRTCFVADKTGHALLNAVYEQTVKRHIPVFGEWFVFSLVADERSFYGLLAYDHSRGRIGYFSARVGLIATGGAARIYGQSSNALINTGDGMSLCLRRGLPLEDMEFFQIHPTGLLNGILISEGARGEGAYLINATGERFMERYAPTFMELAPRDMVSRAVQQEINEGRGFSDGAVRLDLRHLGADKIKARLPQIREIAINFAGVDPIDDPIPVRPTVHYTMGGIEVNVDCKARIDGLFSAGEASCVSVHGANRLGGNSLLEATAYGLRAGETIPDYLSHYAGPDRRGEDALIADEMGKFAALFGDDNPEDVPSIRREMERAMVANFGLFKREETMRTGLDDIERLVERFKRVRVRERSLIFNWELLRAIELGSMLDIARVSALASLHRRESRGGHYRMDYPQPDNENFLKHSLVELQPDGSLKLSYKPVTIIDMQPEERRY